jgi:putative transposase
MPNYRRLFEAGGSYFFTVNLADRRQSLLVDRAAALMCAIHKVKHKRPFRLDALVILPNHLHAIWTLPEGDTDFPTRWRLIKTQFARAIPNTEPRSKVHIARGERAVWQRRYWEHLIRDDGEYERLVEYCYFNPARHGLVERIWQWPHSTYHRDVRVGLFPRDFDVTVDGSGKLAH